MKKLTLFVAALVIAGSAYACDGSKDCCKKGQKNGKACCKKEAAATTKAGCEKKGCDKNHAKVEDAKQTATPAASSTEKKSRS